VVSTPWSSRFRDGVAGSRKKTKQIEASTDHGRLYRLSVVALSLCGFLFSSWLCVIQAFWCLIALIFAIKVCFQLSLSSSFHLSLSITTNILFIHHFESLKEEETNTKSSLKDSRRRLIDHIPGLKNKQLFSSLSSFSLLDRFIF